VVGFSGIRGFGGGVVFFVVDASHDPAFYFCGKFLHIRILSGFVTDTIGLGVINNFAMRRMFWTIYMQ